MAANPVTPTAWTKPSPWSETRCPAHRRTAPRRRPETSAICAGDELMPAVVVPGVRVEARFDVLPPLPATSGILGVVGIVDRQPQGGGLVGVTKTSELRELLGPGTLYSMPEAVHALSNGAGEVVIAPVAGGAP